MRSDPNYRNALLKKEMTRYIKSKGKNIRQLKTDNDLVFAHKMIQNIILEEKLNKILDMYIVPA